MTRFGRRRSNLAPSVLLALLLGLTPAVGRAQGSLPQHDPLLISLFTETELGGMGCLTLSLASGVALWRAMGGAAGLALAVNGGGGAPTRVLEAAAAGAFVFSSTYYIGQTLALLTTTVATSLYEALCGPGPGPGPGAGGARPSRSTAPPAPQL